MMMRRARLFRFWVLAAVLVSASGLSIGCRADSDIWANAGHAKYQFNLTTIPKNSIFREIVENTLVENSLESRFRLSARKSRWEFNAHPQFIAVYSDRLPVMRELPDITGATTGVINDDRRWFNLTHEFTNEDKRAAVIRLDRVNISFAGDRTVIRFGRQAISWGNGLLFTPMDIFNPFDPAAVDKEYKAGDDMLYGQYLQNNGNDFQTVAVVRRDPFSGEVESDQSSLALKYHGFAGGSEYDILAARHFGDDVLGLGLSTDFGGAIWRGDLVYTETDHGRYWSAVAGGSYSGVLNGHNWTGFLEYFYNGYGQKGGQYSPAELATNPELLKRLVRGELFNLGQHYLGASVTFELTPLLNLTPNVFVNLADPSALAQLVCAYDWKQDIQLLGALNLPLGADGTEFGGIESTRSGQYLSTGTSVYLQFAWYF